MIEVSKVTKRFGDNQVLRGVDLTVAGGRVMGLVGPNGAGKTTLIKTLLGLCQPTSGEIRIDGETILGTEGSYRARIGYMPQIARFPENLTGAELFDMLRDLRGEPGLLDAELLRGFALEVGGQLDKPLRVLSGGTRQKVNACLALLFRPSILVLDEPTVGLHPSDVEPLNAILRELAQRDNLVLVVEHDPAVIRGADRVIELGPGAGNDGGRVVEDAPPSSFRSDFARSVSFSGTSTASSTS